MRIYNMPKNRSCSPEVEEAAMKSECSTATIYRRLKGGLSIEEATFVRHKHCAAVYFPEHSIWLGMIDRCTNEKNAAYPNYGGRGIKVCQEWIDSFLSFYEDMGKRPSRKHSIDRIDNNGNYDKSNCRWTTTIVQNNNRRDRYRATVSEEVELSAFL